MAERNVAVVGTGYIGVEHTKAIAASPRAQLHTICATQRSEGTARGLMSTYGAGRVVTDYGSVVSDPDVDIVYLCTPNSLHEPQAVAALEAGKHVFVEKPLAVTVEQCQSVVDASRRSTGKVMVGHGARFSPLFHTIHGLVAGGWLGEACFVEGDYVHDLGPFLDLPGHDWWMDSEKEGELPITGGACHPLDLMRWIAGEIVEVSAYGANRNIPQAPWHDTVIASLKFASGAVGKCLTSCGAKIPYGLNLSYYGTKGSVIKNRLYVDGIPNVADFMEMPIEVRPEDHRCAEELDHFLDAIERGEPPLVDGVEGARSVSVCCAVVASVESGSPAEVFLDF